MDEIKDIEPEQKTELGETSKSNLAKRGFGFITVVAATVILVYLIVPFGNNKKQDETKEDEKPIVTVEKRNFTPELETKIFQSTTDGQLQSQIFDTASESQIPIKGLSGGALPRYNPTVTQASTQSSVASDTKQRLDTVKANADKMQQRVDALISNVMGAGGVQNGASDDGAAAVTDTSFIVTARKSVLDPNLAIEKGTFLPCVLKTRIVSVVAGNIACIITDDVYSTAGTVLLIEKGSIVQGFFKGDKLSPGVTRLFVIWEEIKTPKQIIINVNAPATDALGGSGVDGWVDNHYMERFGAAVLLSMIDDAFSALFNNKDGRDYTMNTRENTAQMASTALENTINIPPTLYKNQGDIVGIYVNKDIDFSKVYTLKRSNTRIAK